MDHEELAGSLGTSSVFHGSTTTIPFACGTARGFIHIQRDRWLGFRYACVADGRSVSEATTMNRSSTNDAPAYEGRVSGHCMSLDHAAPQPITWYAVETRERDTGRAVTVTHRRFRDFAELDESVQAALSGHHMRSSMPTLPAKRFKLAIDHSSEGFVRERAAQLDAYARRLSNIPHAWAAPATAPFFGVAANAREYSLVFADKTLGFTIGKASPKQTPQAHGAYEPPDFPAYVASIQDHARPGETPHVGHLVSKISGRSTCNLAFKDVIAAVKYTPRPILIHFIAKLQDDHGPPLDPSALDTDDTENVFVDPKSVTL